MAEVFIPDQGYLRIFLGEPDHTPLIDNGYNSVLRYELSYEIKEWLWDNVDQGSWRCNYPLTSEASGVTLTFNHECDMIAFKLRWMN